MSTRMALAISKLQSQKREMKRATAGDCHGVYAYLRERDSEYGKAGSPYYIGKMADHGRPWGKHALPIPKDPRCIRVLKGGLTAEQAAEWEMRYIARYGRIDNGTGILRNRTDGGEGIPGFSHKEVSREKMRFAQEKRSRAAADRFGISYEVWESFSTARRQVVAVRYRRGLRGAELLNERSAQAEDVSQRLGIDYEVWTALPARGRKRIRERHKAGVRGPALLEALDTDSNAESARFAAEKHGVPCAVWVGLSESHKTTVRRRYQSGIRGEALLSYPIQVCRL